MKALVSNAIIILSMMVKHVVNGMTVAIVALKTMGVTVVIVFLVMHVNSA